MDYFVAHTMGHREPGVMAHVCDCSNSGCRLGWSNKSSSKTLSEKEKQKGREPIAQVCMRPVFNPQDLKK
jgi:hypothetical protein